ncbi:hypothetical protein KXX51_008552, partial [Aspergillus fumigatus]
GESRETSRRLFGGALCPHGVWRSGSRYPADSQTFGTIQGVESGRSRHGQAVRR